MASRPSGTLNEGSGTTVSRLVVVVLPLLLDPLLNSCAHRTGRRDSTVYLQVCILARRNAHTHMHTQVFNRVCFGVLLCRQTHLQSVR